VEQADAERDARKRSDLYHKAAQLLMDEAPVAVLSHSAVARLVKPWVHGLGTHPTEHYEGQATLMKLRILKH
jgi:ABC-type transport system substrate-binding protein